MSGVFVRECAHYLKEVYVPRLEAAVDALPQGDLWWAPHGSTLSVGVILRHLEGNVRQWILSGLAGAPDHRERASEFADPDDRDGHGLLAKLRETVGEAARAIEAIDDADLETPRNIQGMETTILGAVLHVVEHSSWPTGQAVWIAKARAGNDHGIAFYDDAVINAARNPTE